MIQCSGIWYSIRHIHWWNWPILFVSLTVRTVERFHCSIGQGKINYDLCQLLIPQVILAHYKADVNAVDNSVNTPLHLAAANGHELVCILTFLQPVRGKGAGLLGFFLSFYSIWRRNKRYIYICLLDYQAVGCDWVIFYKFESESYSFMSLSKRTYIFFHISFWMRKNFIDKLIFLMLIFISSLVLFLIFLHLVPFSVWSFYFRRIVRCIRIERFRLIQWMSTAILRCT